VAKKEKTEAKKTKKLTKKQLDKMRQEDKGYTDAVADAMAFLENKKKAIAKISHSYHLEMEELFQEGYEVLLTCIRDFSPIYEKSDGNTVSVKFSTFFGNRMENRAMEMRNRDPEYQARKAFTDNMDGDEKTKFKSDPPLLVQHLDQETTMQEHLEGEASIAKESRADDVALRILRDSFFDKKLSELVAKEKDEKKQAALLHVKVGGVYNFQEIAYHFGVTDSRASQVMNELMDAFYVQRMIDHNLESVVYDFRKLKFNEKRVLRLAKEALQNATPERVEEIKAALKVDFPEITKIKVEPKALEEQKKPAVKKTKKSKPKPPAYEEIFTNEENDLYPLIGVEMRSISSLKTTGMDFHPPQSDEEFKEFLEDFDEDSSQYPALVTEDGYILDGERRVKAAKAKGKSEYLCIVRKVTDETMRKILRVVVNVRLEKPTKKDMYYIISTLADLGLSQQKIADILGSSRTNILVYVKVKDKASPKLRALFEDELIQITNASTCADFDEDVQDRLADFIRKYGFAWGKGAKFNTLHLAASEGKLDQLEKKQKPQKEKDAKDLPLEEITGASSKTVQALQERITIYEQSLKDSEIWSAQREGVINSQSEELTDAKEEIERLKRELDAAELVRFGSPKAVEEELKMLKRYYGITERFAAATHGVVQGTKSLRRVDLKRSQLLEITHLMEELESALNTLRVELYNKGAGKTEKNTG
jgi:ParB-like chromosome segregation protein Spo0J